MKATIFVAVLFVLPTLAAGQEPQGQFGPYHWENLQLRLPDGDTLPVYRVKLWQFGSGQPPALQLEYEPPLSVADTNGVRRLLNRVWPAFAPYVQALHLTSAIVTATNLVRHGAPPLPWTATFNSYGYVLVQGSDGGWVLDKERTGPHLPESLPATTYLIFLPDGSRLTPKPVPAPH